MADKYPRITFIYNRRKTASNTRKASIEMRITHNYKQQYISTGIMLYPNQWKNGKIVNCTDIIQISQALDLLLSEVRQVIFAMMSEGKLDITSIPDRLRRPDNPSMTFIEFCKQRADIRKFCKEKDTQERYDRFIRLFSEWGGIACFEEITDYNIIQYDNYLSSKGMKTYSKWNNYHRFLNSFIMDAIDEGYIKRNPYKWVNIAKGKSSLGIDKCLTPAEFRKLKGAAMPTESLSRVRDVFIFQTYTCLRYSDLALFDARYIKEIKGMKVYIREAKKTNKPFTVPILSPAWDILMKYKGKLPIISNVKYNLYLKNIAQAASIDKPISSHWARHTGATILLNEGVDLKVVSKICGHSSTRMTEQVYAKLLDETIVEAVQDLDI